MKEIIEKLDAIEASTKETAKVEAVAAAEAIKTEFAEKVAALEAKIASVQAPAIIRPIAKTVRTDVNRAVREQLSSFYKGGKMLEKELSMFADESQYHAYLAEASALTAGGDGKGGRTGVCRFASAEPAARRVSHRGHRWLVLPVPRQDR